MSTIRVGVTNKKGTYKNIVLQLDREIKIGIGYKIDKRLEVSLLRTFDLLESTLIRGDEINQDLHDRIAKLPAGIQRKLVAKGLVRQIHAAPSLQCLVTEFLNSKLPNQDPRTIRNYRVALKGGVLKFVGADTRVDQVDSDMLIEFIENSAKQYKESTVANHIKRARALFRYALDKRYLSENPFEAGRVKSKCALFRVKLASEREETQRKFMKREEIDRLLNCTKSERSVIEDKEWNVLVWLLRYGGARVSSYLVLRWSDIDFENKTMQLRMKQTKRCRFERGNKKPETVPLFKQLRAPLNELKALQPPGTIYVLNQIGNLRDKPEFETTSDDGERVRQGRWETNLSTTFKKILARNGFGVWSQPFHAFRSLRAAELAVEGATELQISKWIGNSLEVRKKHYATFALEGAEKFTE